MSENGRTDTNSVRTIKIMITLRCALCISFQVANHSSGSNGMGYYIVARKLLLQLPMFVLLEFLMLGQSWSLSIWYMFSLNMCPYTSPIG